ncbi:CITE1 protein, partial [Agelaius phoeniceus]|nr:CITE1 protein [Agelaius phoeniceus]
MPAVGTPPAPRPCGPPRRVPTALWVILCLQKFHVQNRAPGRLWSPTEPGSPLAWGLGTQPRGAGSRPLQAAGPGLIDSDPTDKVLRSLVVELGLNRADELPELWFGHHELDSQSDLPAGARLGR